MPYNHPFIFVLQILAILGINSHAKVVVVSILPENAMATPIVQTGPTKSLVGIEEKVSINLL